MENRNLPSTNPSAKAAGREDWENWEEEAVAPAPAPALIDLAAVKSTSEAVNGDRDIRTGKFVDPYALTALEGASVGEGSGFSLFKKSSKDKQARKAEKAEKDARKAAAKADKAAAKLAKLRGEAQPEPRSISPITVPKGQQSRWSSDSRDGSFTPSPMSSTDNLHGRLPAPLVPTSTGATQQSRGLSVSDDGIDRRFRIGNPDSASRGHWDEVTIMGTANSQPPLPAFQPQAITDKWWTKVDEKKEIEAREKGVAIASSSRTGSPPTRSETLCDKARILAEENQKMNLEVHAMELPPPYSAYTEKSQPQAMPMAPRPVSPTFTQQMTGSGAISMMDMPAMPQPVVTHNTGSTRLPDREIGTYLPDHSLPVNGDGPRQKVERSRRFWELEEYWGRLLLGPWRNRGPFSEQNYFTRPGREGRNRRLVCYSIFLGLLVLIPVSVVLAVMLTKHNKSEAPVATPSTTSSAVPVSSSPAETSAPAPAPFSPWLNLTDFPPVPTGVLTVVGPRNGESVSDCVAPSTLWSCDLPPEQQDANAPYQPSQPMFILQIQYDNSSAKAWNVTGEAVPTVTTAASSTSSSGANGQGLLGTATFTATQTARASTTVATAANKVTAVPSGVLSALGKAPATKNADRRGLVSLITGLFRRSDLTERKTDPGFTPNPPPPSFQEMWFLGNWTDGIHSDEKAGEPTPFYISVLPNLDSSAGANVLNSRDSISGVHIDGNSPDIINGTISGPGTATNLTAILPPPELNPDGTGAPARLVPNNVAQQPLRLFDRGLPTEHYGFYTYFNKTIYVRSVSGNGSNFDATGGANESEASQVAYFGYTRFLVQMWTRLGEANATTSLLGGGALTPDDGGNNTQPGTFPYPVTFSVDNHGGPPGKWAWWYNVTDDSKIDVSAAGLINIDYNFMPGSSSTAPGVAVNVNGYGETYANPSYGGAFGGSGGCRCTYQNFNFTLPDGSQGFVAG